MTVSETQIERGMKVLHEISIYRGYNQEARDREWSRMEGIYRSQVTAILTAALSDQAMVPKEPTPEMIEAGASANPTVWNDGTDDGFACDVADEVYRAMVAAAPPPSSTAGEAQGG